MLAVKRGYFTTVRAILEFGATPAVIVHRDADGSTPLHIAVQNMNTAIVEVLLQYGPMEYHYMENSVGQTPLDIANLKVFPPVTVPVEAGPREPQVNVDFQLRLLKNAAPFDVEKQKVEVPKLRATLNALLANGRLIRDTKLAAELLAFAAHLEEKLAIEIANNNAAGKDDEGGDEVDPVVPQSTTASTYALLQDAAAARPGRRQLVHLADVQQSVKRCLAREAEKALFRSNLGIPAGKGEESKEADAEEQRIAQLKARSLFRTASTILTLPYKAQVSLFGEDRY